MQHFLFFCVSLPVLGIFKKPVDGLVVLISAKMVWVHTCVFPFYSELCAVRCGTHSTTRGVHTLFAPIDVQHAATEGHLEEREETCSGEREERERELVRVVVCFFSATR